MLSLGFALKKREREMSKRYASFLVKNVALVSSIEGVLRSLAYMIPKSDSSKQLTSQFLLASLLLLHLAHYQILEKKALISHHPKSYGKNRFIRALLKGKYRTAAFLLSFLQAFQIMAEMAAYRVSDHVRKRTCILIESVKCDFVR
jgi:hypothetical protein